jgi:MFS family permease
MAASAVFLLLHETFATTGWRIAMLLSVVVVVPALIARYKLADSPLFENLRRREQVSRMPSFAVFRKHSVPIALLAIVLAFQLMDSVVTGTYVITFMRFAGIPLAATGAIIFVSRIGDVLGVLVSGPLADLCKRRTVAYFAIGLATLLSYPFVLAILEQRILLATVLQFLIVFLGMGLLHGLAPVLTAESFPTRFRYSGSGLSFGVAGLLGGMIAPPLLARLVGEDVHANWHYLPMVYVVYCAAAMLALRFIPETRDLRLEDLDEKRPVEAGRNGNRMGRRH